MSLQGKYTIVRVANEEECRDMLEYDDEIDFYLYVGPGLVFSTPLSMMGRGRSKPVIKYKYGIDDRQYELEHGADYIVSVHAAPNTKHGDRTIYEPEDLEEAMNWPHDIMLFNNWNPWTESLRVNAGYRNNLNIESFKAYYPNKFVIHMAPPKELSKFADAHVYKPMDFLKGLLNEKKVEV